MQPNTWKLLWECYDVEHGDVQLEAHVIKKRVWKRGVKLDFAQFFFNIN
jgi:hypothetical protein